MSSKAKQESRDSSGEHDHAECLHGPCDHQDSWQLLWSDHTRGSERRKCEQCGEEYTVVVDDLCEHVAYDVTSKSEGLYTEWRKCSDCGHAWGVFAKAEEFALAPPPAPQLMPYEQAFNAIVYSTGGVLHTVVVEQGTTVVAEDGYLHLSHASSVHGIVAVRPVQLDMPAGEEQSDEPDAENGQG